MTATHAPRSAHSLHTSAPREHAPPDDDALISAIANKSYPLESFTHAEHVHLAWSCLRRHSLLPALSEFRRLLIAYATHHGKPTLYHETITIAYLLLVYERICRTPHLTTWSAFSSEHADLLQWRTGPFFTLYSAEILQNPIARAQFVLP